MCFRPAWRARACAPTARSRRDHSWREPAGACLAQGTRLVTSRSPHHAPPALLRKLRARDTALRSLLVLLLGTMSPLRAPQSHA